MKVLNKTKYVLFLPVLLMLSACSIKTLYNNLDWVLSGMVEDYITLSDEQELNVDKQIEHLLKWHRKTQLEVYARDLDEIKQYTQAGLNEENTEIIFNKFLGYWNAIRDRVAPDMADLFLTLDDKQVKGMFERFKEQNEELEEEWADTTEEEKRENSVEKLTDNFSDWLGPLSDEQKNMLQGWPENFKPMHHHRMAFRKAWQDKLKQLLNNQDIDAKQKKALLVELVNKPEDYQSEEHKLLLVDNMKQFKSLMITFDQTVTEQQKLHLAERLDYFKKIFTELANEE